MAIDREYLKRQMIDEIDSMHEAQLESIAATQNSFIRWCRETVYRIARAVGEIISAPFRLLDDFFTGLWTGLFG